jgi:hypothetical protein
VALSLAAVYRFRLLRSGIPPEMLRIGPRRPDLLGYGLCLELLDERLNSNMEPDLSSFPIPMDRPRFLPHHEVAMAASDCLSRSPYRSLRGVSCEFHRGVLFLRGRLPSFYQKQLAQEAVAGLHGVSQVVNEIEVLAPACL